MMHKLTLTKPDGRYLILYSARPIAEGIVAPGPEGEVVPRTHLRYHPMRGEWVGYAEHRQNRTFLPSPGENPLAPTKDPLKPTELPDADYDVAVFENRFPSLSRGPETPFTNIVETKAGYGVCEVIVYTRDPAQSLGRLPLNHVELIIDVWADRYLDLGSDPRIQYVMPFENRGVEVGVTLHHPHGQIYAYPFVPPVPAKELYEQRRRLESFQSALMEQHIAAEVADERRMVYSGEHVVAFMPAFARYPYEVWIAPRKAVGSLPDLGPSARAELAAALKTVLLKYDGLWNRPFPYVMVLHQAPTDGAPHPEAHFHIEFYPAYRSSTKLKYLAGTEIGAGMFANDSVPETQAAELRAVKVVVE
jgi:UDPglucose--hexose-1-phosphate uridylyltransferase